MAGKPRYRLEEILAAVQGSGGIVSACCRRLGCSWDCFDSYRKKFPVVAERLATEREVLLDFAESKLVELIKSGNIISILFFLKTQGKNRGWVERQETTGAYGTSAVIEIKWPEDKTADESANAESTLPRAVTGHTIR